MKNISKLCKMDCRGRIKLPKRIADQINYKNKLILDFDLINSYVVLEPINSLVHLWKVC